MGSRRLRMIPSIALLTPSQLLNARSTLKAIADSSGKPIVVNPMPGALGSLSETTIEGSGAFRLDVNLIKKIKFHEGKELQFRADAINLLNSPQFGFPDLNINSTTFGRVTDAGGNRMIALSTRISF